jgi:DNA topoisomerase IB
MSFARALPRIRSRVDHDLKLPGLPREKVVATVVKLLEVALIRIGNEEYAKSNKSFGLTTMYNRHVVVNGATAIFEFRGKAEKNTRSKSPIGDWPQSCGSAKTCQVSGFLNIRIRRGEVLRSDRRM